MFNHVVVGVGDEDQPARGAIALAEALAGARGRLTLLHVDVVRFEPAAGAISVRDAEKRDHALDRLRALAGARGVEADVAWRAGRSVGRALHRFASDRRADLIVVAATRDDDIDRALVGDDTGEVLRDAPCAVAVAVAPPAWSARAIALKRVGVAYDGSASSERALSTARALAAEHRAELSAFEAVREPLAVRDVWDVEGEIADEVDAARRRLSALGGLEAEAGSFADDEAGELARYGRSVDLLVLGGHRSEPMDELFGGSVAERIADQAPCALLVLPSAARTRITRTA